MFLRRLLSADSAILLGLVLAAGLAVFPAKAGTLAPHRVLYDLKGDATVDLEGRMLFELVDACDGWAVKQQTVLRASGLRGQTQSFISSTSWESKDGRRFRFKRTIHRNGALVESVNGRAELDKNGAGTVLLHGDKDASGVALPAGTVFPARHTLELIDTAKRGDRFLLRNVFDGSAGNAPNKVSAVIGNPQELPGLADPATKIIAWPVRLAFFSLDSRSELPDVEIAVLMQEDGVARRITLYYPDMTVFGTIAKFTLLPPAAC